MILWLPCLETLRFCADFVGRFRCWQTCYGVMDTALLIRRVAWKRCCCCMLVKLEQYWHVLTILKKESQTWERKVFNKHTGTFTSATWRKTFAQHLPTSFRQLDSNVNTGLTGTCFFSSACEIITHVTWNNMHFYIISMTPWLCCYQKLLSRFCTFDSMYPSAWHTNVTFFSETSGPTVGFPSKLSKPKDWTERSDLQIDITSNMGVSKNILIGFGTIIFTIHFGGLFSIPLFLVQHPYHDLGTDLESPWDLGNRSSVRAEVLVAAQRWVLVVSWKDKACSEVNEAVEWMLGMKWFPKFLGEGSNQLTWPMGLNGLNFLGLHI